MGRALKSLSVGSIIFAQLTEQVTPTDYIVEYKGELIRVTNGSNQKFSVGDQIKLRVISLGPLRFQIDQKGFRYSVSV